MGEATATEAAGRLWASRVARLGFGLTAAAFVFEGFVTAMALRALRSDTPMDADALREVLALAPFANRALTWGMGLTALSFVLWLALTTAEVKRRGGDTRDLRRGPTWAILCWLVPIGNLYLPMRLVSDIYAVLTGARDQEGAPRTPWPVFSWWALWLGGLGLSLASETARRGGPGRHAEGFTLQLASAPAFILSAVLGVFLVTRIERALTER